MIGLVVGKFYPLHRGHTHLLDVASSRTSSFWVVVSEGADEAIPAETRADWIRQMYSNAKVVVTPYDIPDEPGPWARRCLEILGSSPDLVFTSESYGDGFASELGADHVLVDPQRSDVPISGSELRGDLGSAFRMLAPPAAAALARRVCVVGVESSGTTTLARALARHYETVWVPEFGRWYWEGRRHTPDAGEWDSEEFTSIAREQARQENLLARRANRIVVADTDALATHVWHRRYMGFYSDEVWSLARRQLYDLYLLTAPDFPFVQDGTREGEAVRDAMHLWFIEALERAGHRYVVVDGTPAHRMARAIAAIDPLLEFEPMPASRMVASEIDLGPT